MIVALLLYTFNEMAVNTDLSQTCCQIRKKSSTTGTKTSIIGELICIISLLFTNMTISYAKYTVIAIYLQV